MLIVSQLKEEKKEKRQKESRRIARCLASATGRWSSITGTEMPGVETAGWDGGSTSGTEVCLTYKWKCPMGQPGMSLAVRGKVWSGAEVWKLPSCQGYNISGSRGTWWDHLGKECGQRGGLNVLSCLGPGKMELRGRKRTRRARRPSCQEEGVSGRGWCLPNSQPNERSTNMLQVVGDLGQTASRGGVGNKSLIVVSLRERGKQSREW